MSDKKPWADEPTPLCDEKEIYYSDIGYSSIAMRYVELDVAEDLERRLRHALKLVNSLRIGALLTDDWTMLAADGEHQLRAVEEVLTL